MVLYYGYLAGFPPPLEVETLSIIGAEKRAKSPRSNSVGITCSIVHIEAEDQWNEVGT